MNTESEKIIMNGIREELVISLNDAIIKVKEKDKEFPVGRISDGYHTFDELYEHRIVNYIKLCEFVNACSNRIVWRSGVHSDGTVHNGWFLLGINTEPGRQITYHLPDDKWGDTDFALTFDRAPEWDGHTPADVLKRLKQL